MFSFFRKLFKNGVAFRRRSLPNRASYPASTPQVTPQVRELLNVFIGDHSRTELQANLRLSDRENFRINYLVPAIENDVVELTIPDKPKSSKQRYRLTEKEKKARQE
ncbi:Fic family protein [Salegentibacter echinorum]|uniref:Fic family protein n=1 Tax=Salegentibacter echinorum TaxID=1073325 RepID=UPI000A66137A|nr:hypothetical protein [Salegentibacter echinorum]